MTDCFWNALEAASRNFIVAHSNLEPATASKLGIANLDRSLGAARSSLRLALNRQQGARSMDVRCSLLDDMDDESNEYAEMWEGDDIATVAHVDGVRKRNAVTILAELLLHGPVTENDAKNAGLSFAVFKNAATVLRKNGLVVGAHMPGRQVIYGIAGTSIPEESVPGFQEMRERDERIKSLASGGKTAEAVARTLGISAKTVRRVLAGHRSARVIIDLPITGIDPQADSVLRGMVNDGGEHDAKCGSQGDHQGDVGHSANREDRRKVRNDRPRYGQGAAGQHRTSDARTGRDPGESEIPRAHSHVGVVAGGRSDPAPDGRERPGARHRQSVRHDSWSDSAESISPANLNRIQPRRASTFECEGA